MTAFFSPRQNVFDKWVNLTFVFELHIKVERNASITCTARWKLMCGHEKDVLVLLSLKEKLPISERAQQMARTNICTALPGYQPIQS